MKNKIFSKGLYAESLRQLRIAGIIAVVLSFFSAALTPFFHFIDYMSASSDTIRENMLSVVDFNEFLPSLTSLLFWGPIFAFILFSQFNRRVASDFYHSLPYTRLCTYISFTAAVITWIAVVGVAYSAASIIIHACMPFLYILSFAGVFDYILTIVAATLVLTFGTICAITLTGTVISNLVVAGMIIAGPRAALLMLAHVIRNLAPVLSIDGGFLDENFNVLFGLFSYGESFIENIGRDIYTIALALVYFALGALFFNFRKSETAGQTAGNKYMQDGIRIALAFAISALGTGLYMTEIDVISLIVLYVFAVLAYFVFELITKKSFRSLPRTIPGLGIVIVLNIALVGICYGSAAYVHSYTPDADDIKGFYIMSDELDQYYMGETMFSWYADSFTEKVLVEDTEAIEAVAESLKESVEESKARRFNSFKYDRLGEIEYKREVVRIVGKNGLVKSRVIWVSTENSREMYDAVKEMKEYRDIYTNLPEALERSIHINGNISGAGITAEQYLEIYDTLRSEVKDIEFSVWYDAMRNFGQGEEDPTVLYITFVVKKDGTMVTVPLQRDIVPKTYLKIIEMANQGAEEKARKMSDIIEKYEADSFVAEEGKHEYCYVNMTGVSEKYGGVWSYNIDLYLKDDAEAPDFETRLEYSKYMASEIHKAAESDKKPDINEFIIVHLTVETYDEDDVSVEYEMTEFTVPYPEDIDILESYVEKMYTYPKNNEMVISE